MNQIQQKLARHGTKVTTKALKKPPKAAKDAQKCMKRSKMSKNGPKVEKEARSSQIVVLNVPEAVKSGLKFEVRILWWSQ